LSNAGRIISGQFMSNWSFSSVGLILIVACIVAMITRRIGLPYSVGLVLAGMALSFAPVTTDFTLSSELILQVFLPPLVFEGALQLGWKRFRKELPVTLTLAVVGVVASAALIASGMHYFVGWSWIGAAFFGTLIAATDPVSVIAAFREQKAEPRIRMVVESESLLNDGIAAVGFTLLLAIAAGLEPTVSSVSVELLRKVAVGVLGGAAVAGGVLLLAGRTTDHLVEITLTTVAAYGSYLLAEHWGGSGVLASLTAGLIVGNLGWMGSISDEGRSHVLNFWDYAAFLVNSFVFILIGFHEGKMPMRVFLPQAALAIVIVLVARALIVYPLSLPFRRTNLRLPAPCLHVLFWGGLRGALALALALSVPASVAEQTNIIVVAFAVVAFSVLVQGTTMPILLNRLGVTGGGNAQS
jgi:CPA1 family monovalent cation:H+ antiporter